MSTPAHKKVKLTDGMCILIGKPSSESFNTNDKLTFRRLDGPTPSSFRIQAQTDAITLRGQCDASAVEGFKYAVVTFDPETKTMENIQEARMVPLHLDINSLQVAAAGGGAASETDRTQGFAGRKQLGQTFGTSRTQTAIRSMEQSQINFQNIEGVAGTLSTILQSKADTMSTMEHIQSEANLDRPIPPFNLEATSAEDIYPFDSLITPQESNALSVGKYFKLTNEKYQELETSGHVPAYVLAHLKRRIGVKDSSESAKRILKSLFYLVYLYRFLQLSPPETRTIESLTEAMPDVPSVLLEAFLEKFTHEKGVAKGSISLRERSTKDKDRVIGYILATSLHIENFSLDPTMIAADLKIALPKLGEYYKNMGCKYITRRGKAEGEVKSNSPLVTLHAPLVFPAPKKGPQK